MSKNGFWTPLVSTFQNSLLPVSCSQVVVCRLSWDKHLFLLYWNANNNEVICTTLCVQIKAVSQIVSRAIHLIKLHKWIILGKIKHCQVVKLLWETYRDCPSRRISFPKRRNKRPKCGSDCSKRVFAKKQGKQYSTRAQTVSHAYCIYVYRCSYFYTRKGIKFSNR